MPKKIAIVTLIFLGALWWLEKERPQTPSEDGNSVAAVAETYKSFKTEYADKSFQEQHLAAHEWGMRIFQELGVEGIEVCDSSFGFGCYHSFFGFAISTLGEEAVSDLATACVKKYGEFGTGCQHGIGHGIVEYVGHNNLDKALSLCAKTDQKNPLFGCSSGVFMEYNLPVLIGENIAQTTTRQFDQEQPFAPCNLIAEQFQLSCYYELPQWWLAFVQDSKVGELCAQVQNEDHREVCFLGMGNHVSANKQFDIVKTKDACTELPNDTDKTLCLAGAAWAFFAFPEKRAESRLLCIDLPETAKKICLTKSQPICNYLPESLKTQCEPVESF